MTKLSEAKRKELDEQGREALDKLEEDTLKLLDVVESFTLGESNMSVGDLDEVYKSLKQSAKDTRKISLKYRKHLDAVAENENVKDIAQSDVGSEDNEQDTSQNGEMTA